MVPSAAAPIIPPAERLIVALDVPHPDAALRLVRELGSAVSFYKVGLQLFIAGGGMAVVNAIAGEGKKVFLDLKMDDVDETIRLAVAEVAGSGSVDLLTIFGGLATARAARAGRGEGARPRLLQVTALSSQGEDDLTEMRLVGPGGRFETLEALILWRAARALEGGCDGVIASGTSVGPLREKLGPGPLLVCPGIRPEGSASDEHKRTNTPASAIHAGADYLVVGRPIRDAADRKGAAQRVVAEIESALATRGA